MQDEMPEGGEREDGAGEDGAATPAAGIPLEEGRGEEAGEGREPEPADDEMFEDIPAEDETGAAEAGEGGQAEEEGGEAEITRAEDVQAEVLPVVAKQTKYCPFCGEEILAVARKCKHCGEFLDATARAAAGGAGHGAPVVVQVPQQVQGGAPHAGLGRELATGLIATKSYVGPAFLTLILYWLGYLPGLIANILWLSSAKRDERIAGVPMSGKGCLTFLIWVHLWIPLILLGLALIGLAIIAVVGAVTGVSYMDSIQKYF
ncbi:MAG: hypothetical protein JW909_01865 [Planctomycetes bacterium]|nr:hypothetical protein [Planctomycetota bacterium]